MPHFLSNPANVRNVLHILILAGLVIAAFGFALDRWQRRKKQRRKKDEAMR